MKSGKTEKAEGCCALCCFSKREMPRPRKEHTARLKPGVGNLPFQGDLPKHLHPGTVISVLGYVLPHCVRFAINLLCGTAAESDVALHFNPRLSPKYIVRNSRLNGVWGHEETTSMTVFDIPRNKRILIEILIAEFEFLICINGKHFCAYSYRVPLTQLKSIEVNGPLLVEDIQYRDVEIFPDREHIDKDFGVTLAEQLLSELCKCSDDDKLTIPFTGILANGFPPDLKLEIYGKVKLLPHMFHINLQVGRHTWPHPAIPLHLNPRFSTMLGTNTFVRNTWSNGKWLQEERTPTFPFAPGERFRLSIRREEKHFAIWINDHLTAEFVYRDDNIDDIDTIYIQGDVIINKVFLYERLKLSSLGKTLPSL